MADIPLWQWQDMEEDVPVIFILQYDRNQRDEGVKQKEDGTLNEWHKCCCKVEEKIYTVFSPNKEVYDNWIDLKIGKKGDIFIATAKASLNKKNREST